MNNNDSVREKWNQRYSSSDSISRPSFVLSEFQKHLPGEGRALDIACGSGANTIFLAERGFTVDAWDISDVAINNLAERTRSLTVEARQLDITSEDFPKDTWDVIVNCHYLDRSILPAIRQSLKPGGVIFFQTFSRSKKIAFGPSDPDMLLAAGELEEMMSGLEILAYQDEGESTDEDHPLAGRSCIVARKPTP